MRILTCLPLILLLTSPCAAQEKNKTALIEKSYDVSKLINTQIPRPLSLESFLVTPAEFIPIELLPFQRLKSQQVDLTFSESPLSDIVQFLHDITEMNFHSSLDEKLTLDLRLKSVRLGHALLVILEKIDADATFGGSILYIHPKRRVPQSVLNKSLTIDHQRPLLKALAPIENH